MTVFSTGGRRAITAIALVFACGTLAVAQERRLYSPPELSAVRAIPAEKSMVVAQERLAAQVGADILRQGGNAVDAAVATGFALAVTYPRAGKLVIVDLAKMKPYGEQKVGAVPVSVAVVARKLAIADPSAKRVWMIEGAQTFGQAVARGFLRGLIGLGLNRNRTSQFPSGVDRVLARGSSWIAYDSSTGTIYRGGKPIAQAIGPRAFALTGEKVVWWDDVAQTLLSVP